MLPATLRLRWHSDEEQGTNTHMMDVLKIVGIVGGYIAIQYWILPRLGVRT